MSDDAPAIAPPETTADRRIDQLAEQLMQLRRSLAVHVDRAMTGAAADWQSRLSGMEARLTLQQQAQEKYHANFEKLRALVVERLDKAIEQAAEMLQGHRARLEHIEQKIREIPELIAANEAQAVACDEAIDAGLRKLFNGHSEQLEHLEKRVDLADNRITKVAEFAGDQDDRLKNDLLERLGRVSRWAHERVDRLESLTLPPEEARDGCAPQPDPANDTEPPPSWPYPTEDARRLPRLFRISFDGQADFVEAPTMPAAIEAWHACRRENDPEWDQPETPEPDDCHLMHDEPVMRAGGGWSQLWQAMGLLSTLHPTMTIDGSDPLEMARQIVDHVERRGWQIGVDPAAAPPTIAGPKTATEAMWPTPRMEERRRGRFTMKDHVRELQEQLEGACRRHERDQACISQHEAEIEKLREVVRRSESRHKAMQARLEQVQAELRQHQTLTPCNNTVAFWWQGKVEVANLQEGYCITADDDGPIAVRLSSEAQPHHRDVPQAAREEGETIDELIERVRELAEKRGHMSEQRVQGVLRDHIAEATRGGRAGGATEVVGEMKTDQPRAAGKVENVKPGPRVMGPFVEDAIDGRQPPEGFLPAGGNAPPGVQAAG